MERSQEGERTLAERVVEWRSVGLIGACVACGVTLSMMVIGSVPTISGPVSAAPQALPAEVVVADQPTTDPVAATTEAVPESTEQPVDAGVTEEPAPSQHRSVVSWRQQREARQATARVVLRGAVEVETELGGGSA